MTAEVAEIREQMATIRGRLVAAAQDVSDDARMLSDWRHYVRRFPWVSVAIAAAVGFSIVPRRPAPAGAVDHAALRRVLDEAKGAWEASKTPTPGLLVSALTLGGPALLRLGLRLLTQRLQSRHAVTSSVEDPSDGWHQERSENT